MPLMRWLVAGDMRRIAGFGVCAGTATIGIALGIRQGHLSKSPMIDAAGEQLRHPAVTEWLGDRVGSVGGIIGGYIDPVQGTSVLTIPLRSEGGVRAVARVEAEAEWVPEWVAAAARGEEGNVTKDVNCRWLMRHLEVDLEDAGADSSPLVLYSQPAQLPLSCWAPSRTPSGIWSLLPRSVRAMLPEPTGVSEDEAMNRLMGFGALAVGMHIISYFMLRRRIGYTKVLDRVESMLQLRQSPHLGAIRETALRMARKQDGLSDIALRENSILVGVESRDHVVAYTELANKSDLLFSAERVTAGGDWMIKTVSVASTEMWAKRASRLPEGTASERYGEELSAFVHAIPQLNLPLDRRVLLQPPADGGGGGGKRITSSKRKGKSGRGA